MKTYLSLAMCANLILLPGCGKQGEGGKSASESVAIARQLYEAGQLQAARKEIEAAIKADPKQADAHLLAGRIAQKSGDVRTALSEYVGADAMARGNEKARLAAAALLLRSHAYTLAEEWITKCLADTPGDRAIVAYRSLLEQRLGDTRKARADAEAILAEDQGNAMANAVLAEQALSRKDPVYAVTMIEAGLSTDPADRTLLQLKAEAFLQQQRPEQAIDIYNALVAVDPTAPDDRAALAELIANNAGVGQGEQVLRQGIAAAPDSIDMHMQLVAFMARHRDKQAVVDELVAAINSAPETTVYDVALAEFDARDNGFDAAVKVLKEAIARTRSEPAHSVAQLALARLLIRSDDTVNARAIVDAMLKARPADDDVIAIRAELKLKDQDAPGAIQDFLSVAGHKPATPEVFASLAEAYLRNDQRSEAIAALKRVLSLRPADSGSLMRIVEIFTGFGDVASASRAVEDFLAHNPGSIEVRAIQIQLAIQSQDWTAADVALTELGRIPDSEPAATGLDAKIREARSQFADAATLYRRILVRRDDGRFNVLAARAFARVSIAARQGSEALDVLTRSAGSVAPADLASYDLILADLNDSLGRSERSQALIEAAVRAAPADPAAYLQQTAVHARSKEFAAALAMLARGIAAGAAKEPLLVRRAEVQIASGHSDDAIETYRNLLIIDPRSVIAANEMANLLADHKPLDKAALRQARDAVGKNAVFRNPAILDTLAWSDYRLGELQEAKRLLNLANADQSPNPQLRFHDGVVLIASGERLKGQDIIRSTLNDAYPGRNEAEEILR